MPHSPKYVILDTFYSDTASAEVMVYGPYTEATGSRALARGFNKIQQSEKVQSLKLRTEHVPGQVVTVKDSLGIVRELKMLMLHLPL